MYCKIIPLTMLIQRGYPALFILPFSLSYGMILKQMFGRVRAVGAKTRADFFLWFQPFIGSFYQTETFDFSLLWMKGLPEMSQTSENFGIFDQ